MSPKAEPPRLGRRIVRLFRPHRGALALIIITILVTSALSVISALLVRQVFDKALFVQGGPDLAALYPLVAALIAIPIINGILNVVQVYLTEVVGNRTLQERERDINAKPRDLRRLAMQNPASATTGAAAAFARPGRLRRG